MLAYQKLIFFRACGLTILNSQQDLNKIIDQYDSMVENTEINDLEKIEILALLKEIMNSVKTEYRARNCDFADLLIVKFPEWKKDFLLIKIKTLINIRDMNKAVETADEYITAFGLDNEVATSKIEALMSMEYENVVDQIEELMEFLKKNIK